MLRLALIVYSSDTTPISRTIAASLGKMLTIPGLAIDFFVEPLERVGTVRFAVMAWI
jgi:hypothetical protein